MAKRIAHSWFAKNPIRDRVVVSARPVAEAFAGIGRVPVGHLPPGQTHLVFVPNTNDRPQSKPWALRQRPEPGYQRHVDVRLHGQIPLAGESVHCDATIPEHPMDLGHALLRPLGVLEDARADHDIERLVSVRQPIGIGRDWAQMVACAEIRGEVAAPGVQTGAAQGFYEVSTSTSSCALSWTEGEKPTQAAEQVARLRHRWSAVDLRPGA